MIRVVIPALLLFSTIVAADTERAHVNYMIHCQGCHLPDASGYQDIVPRMNNFIGYYLGSEAGRNFIIRVPGVATAHLPDNEIAELMNWLIETYSAQQRPDNFVPYTAAEVGKLRKTPEAQPLAARREILAKIAAGKPELAQVLAAGYDQTDK